MTQDTMQDTLGEANPMHNPDNGNNIYSGHPDQMDPTKGNAENAIIQKYAKAPAKRIALQAEQKRVSRRLLLAIRSQKLTIVCPETGIVSLLEAPAIPGFAAEVEHPLSRLPNARGLTQRGQEYLRQLDTQTIAGILLTLANPYELFRFQPFDSGAQKNAILRTAGKDTLINACIIVETLVHSRNQQFLPKLSLIFDLPTENIGAGYKIEQYLQLLVERIHKPDLTPYDENAAPIKVSRPVYIKDVEKKERKISFMARQEISRAKKEFDADKKAAKTHIAELYKANKIDLKGKAVLSAIFADDALLTLPPESRAMVVMKLDAKEHPAAVELITLVKKDRKILTLDVSEVEEVIADKAEDEVLSTEATAETTVTQEEYDDNPTQGIDSEDMGQDSEKQESQEDDIKPPAGLTGFKLLLWKKKIQESRQRNIVQSDIPSVHTYTPSAEKDKLAEYNGVGEAPL